MAARLAANERQRRRFLADITHELRNPLAVLQSRIEAQLDGIHPRDDRHSRRSWRRPGGSAGWSTTCTRWRSPRPGAWSCGEVLVEVAPVAGPGTGDAPMVRCRVTDAGPGFREDRLGRLFERFEPAGDSRGSGLGLSIARDLIRAHGGTIEAGNDPTTGGASVTFTLPV